MTLTRVAAVLLALGAQGALAQNAQPPAQIANHANGLSYQPTQEGVSARERNAGVQTPGNQLSAEDRQLDQINRQLLGPKATPPVQTPAH